MRKVELEVFSDTVNGSVIRHPMRRFPGVLIQGDTLQIMLESVLRLRELTPDSEEYREELLSLQEQLSSLLGHYEQVLQEHGLELPYAKTR